MAALVQTYPQQATTITMLQARPNSASAVMAGGQGQPVQQYGHGSAQQRNSIHGLPGGATGAMGYRANSTPIQPYAFTSTPSLNTNANSPWQQFRTNRTASMPAAPQVQNFDYNAPVARPRYPASASMTNLPSTISVGLPAASSRDDSALPGPGARKASSTPRPQSFYMNGSWSQPSFAAAAPARVSPERYRRPSPRASESSSSNSSQSAHGQGSAPPSGSGMAAVSHLYNPGPRGSSEQKSIPPRLQHPAMLHRPNSFVGSVTGSAVDDMQLYRGPAQEEIKRFRRRSMPTLDSADFPKPLTPPEARPEESSRMEQLTQQKSADKDQKPARSPAGNALVVVDRSIYAVHSRTGSSDSRVSTRSTGSSSRPSSSANRNTNAPTGNPAQFSSAPEQVGTNPDYPRLVNIPPRSSSSDAATTKRLTNPSPLSKPVTMDSEADAGRAAGTAVAAVASPTKPSPPVIESAAVKKLSAINEKGKKLKSKTSRLRRAFSFGSAAEFRDAVTPEADTAENAQTAAPAKLHKEPTADELYDAEQERIAQQQEEAGIGNSIYSGGKLFSGSTDNISISSTASSASIMIRKMGRGMKKGTRSLVGLFRPKSIIGAPSPDSPSAEASQATVSMITVEAERERVNVNADPHSQSGGGTGFPRLERNSIDASKASSTISDRLGSSGTDNSAARKSIVGGERERAEVLAAVRKGILKNTSGSNSPSPRPVDAKGAAFELPEVPHISDSPISSAPSTPNDEAQGHRRTGSVAIGSEDYFMSALRLRQETKSAPGTPQGTLKRNATFSPRIVFYDTWPSQEYDRRGEIATCNRLTPMLAQQIKEELNTFKMEMEVHENSKIYTHFF